VTSVRTSRTRDRGPERRAETAVFGLLFLQGMYHYRVLAKYTPRKAINGAVVHSHRQAPKPFIDRRGTILMFSLHE
ncbi:MAG: hypothetical protein ABSG32_22475, partial [Terriglobia bacterium]